MAVKLINWTPMNQVVSHLSTVSAAIHEEVGVIEGRAKAYLAAANSSTQVAGLDPGPPHFVDSSFGDVDGFVNLNGPNPMALEFGHEPSGAFGPGGRYAHIKSKAPVGLYILTHATGLTGLTGPG